MQQYNDQDQVSLESKGGYPSNRRYIKTKQWYYIVKANHVQKKHTKKTQKEKTRIGKVQETSKTTYNLYTSYEEY